MGANVGMRTPINGSDAAGAKTVGLLWRFGQGHEGWKWQYGLGWYSTDIAWQIGGERTEIGKLSVKPIMAGYGYTHVMGRKSVSAGISGGYAFNKLTQGAELEDIVQARTSARGATIDVGNAWVLRPGVSFWYNMNEKIGLNVGAHYIISRPRVTFTSSSGSESRRIDADMFSVKAGIAYSIF